MVRFLLLVVFMFVLVSPARGQVTAVQADFDGSGVVDFADFLQFVSVFGSATGDDNFQAKFDFDGSGAVDFADFLQFVNVFGQTVPDTDSVDGDRAALIALYNATGGDNWKEKTNWLSDKPLGEWYGVETDTQGRVRGLALWQNNLSGSIPPELGNLSKLIWLGLYDNQLSGAIPPALGNLSKLNFLLLYNNQLSGSIPPALGNLSKLSGLQLYENQLSGSIPSELGNLLSLRVLKLGSNQLSGSIPPELGNLSELNFLSLYNNQLSGSIPPELGNLSNLEWLFLSYNQLSGAIPESLGNLSKLEYLYLEGNQLSGAIPESLGNLPHLQHFVVGENSNLCMPVSLKKWKFFKYISSGVVSKCPPPQDWGSVDGDRAALIDFYNATGGDNWKKKANWLSDRPLGAWHGVETNTHGRVVRLELIKNQLLGSIPESLGNLTHLEHLVLVVNQLSGSIPKSLGNLPHLEELRLVAAQLSGAIPPELGNLTYLEWLALSQNQLSGSVPPELGNLTYLEHLDLSRNQLSGSIPDSLGNVTNLNFLSLEGNQLSGSIPEWIGNQKRLELLHLRGNLLTGFVPLTFQNLTNLTTLSYGPFVCLPGDPGMQQWVVKKNLLDGWHEGRLPYSGQLLDDCLSPVVESWPPKADLIRQLENLGWFSVSFENADDFDHWHVYAIFEAVQKLNKAIVGFPSHVSVPMKLSVKRSYEAHPDGAIANSGITFFPPAFEKWHDFFRFRDTMIHEIAHNLGINAGRSSGLYTETADPTRWIFNGAQANLKYKELKGNRVFEGRAFENELITDGSGHWGGAFMNNEVMRSQGGPVLSAITLSALVDMGYEVDMTQANKLPFEKFYATKPTLSSAPMLPHAWCGGIAHSHVPHSQ